MVYNDLRGIDITYGYPLALIVDGEYICPDCAENIEDGSYRDAAIMLHMEGPALYCDCCNSVLESAYGEVE